MDDYPTNLPDYVEFYTTRLKRLVLAWQAPETDVIVKDALERAIWACVGHIRNETTPER